MDTPNNTPVTPAKPEQTLLQKIRTGFEVLVVLLWVVFLIQNTEQTQVSFLWMTLTISRIVMLLGTLGIGMIIGALLCYRLCVKRARKKQQPPYGYGQ
jgi:uncharacterized integral membrane protein